MIQKVSAVYHEVADRIAADDNATEEEKRQASELKVIAFTVAAQMGDQEASKKLDDMIADMLKNAKDDAAKIQAYQIKMQAIAAGAQTDPGALDKVADLADEILANKDSDELQVFGLEVKAQAAFTRSRTDDAALDGFLGFLNGYLANEEMSQRAREKAQELKLAALLMGVQGSKSDEAKTAKDAEFEKYFDEVLNGPLSPETRKGVYQMRVQGLMAGTQAEAGLSPEDTEKADALAERLMKEDSEDLNALGYAVKSTALIQQGQKDPSKVEEIFKFADAKLAGNPSDTLKKQMTGLKIQGYMIKLDKDPNVAKEMLAFLDEQLADSPNEDLKTRLATIKIQVLMMQLQNDLSYAEPLVKALDECKEFPGLERLLQSGWGAIYMAKIRDIAENKGSIADLNAVMGEVKEKMADMPVIGFLMSQAKSNFDQIGKNNGDPELAKKTYQDLVAVTKDSDNSLVKQVGTSLQNILDMFELEGKPVAIEGILIGEEPDKKFSTADLNGKYYLVDVWSASDQSYFEILEDLTTLYSDFNPKGFEIVGVNVDENTEALTRAIGVLGMVWPVVSSKLSKDAELEALPDALSALPPGVKVLVGPDGSIAAVDDLDGIREFLVEKLGEPEKANADSKADNK